MGGVRGLKCVSRTAVTNFETGLIPSIIGLRFLNPTPRLRNWDVTSFWMQRGWLTKLGREAVLPWCEQR